MAEVRKTLDSTLAAIGYKPFARSSCFSAYAISYTLLIRTGGA